MLRVVPDGSQMGAALLQENDVEREFQIHRTEHDYSLAEFWRWTLALLIGVIMGVLGFLVDWGIEKLNNIKFNNTVQSIRTVGELGHLLQNASE